MSRSDYQNPLYAFNNPSTSYQRAFWHPGVGAWQLDSKGLGAGLGAYHRSSTYSSSRVAAQHIRDRYCAARSQGKTDYSARQSAWSAWVACGGGICESTFQDIYNASSDFMSVSRDYSVGSWGGMTSSTCRLTGSSTTFTCYLIDPDKAQGHTAWRSASFGPSPITEAFYAHASSGNPPSWYYRHWIPEDTGYSLGVWGRRQNNTDARNALTKDWFNSVTICDTVTGRGNC